MLSTTDCESTPMRTAPLVPPVPASSTKSPPVQAGLPAACPTSTVLRPACSGECTARAIVYTESPPSCSDPATEALPPARSTPPAVKSAVTVRLLAVTEPEADSAPARARPVTTAALAIRCPCTVTVDQSAQHHARRCAAQAKCACRGTSTRIHNQITAAAERMP